MMEEVEDSEREKEVLKTKGTPAAKIKAVSTLPSFTLQAQPLPGEAFTLWIKKVHATSDTTCEDASDFLGSVVEAAQSVLVVDEATFMMMSMLLPMAMTERK
jgi:hypothetical protein